MIECGNSRFQSAFGVDLCSTKISQANEEISLIPGINTYGHYHYEVNLF